MNSPSGGAPPPLESSAAPHRRPAADTGHPPAPQPRRGVTGLRALLARYGRRGALVASALLLVPIAATVVAIPARAGVAGSGGSAVSRATGDVGGSPAVPATSAGFATAANTATTATTATATATTGAPTPVTGKPCTGTSPSGLYGGTLTFTVATITPQLVTADGPAALTVTGTMTNSSASALTAIGYKFQRGDALIGEAAIRAEAAKPCQPITVVNGGFVAVDEDLPAGASTSFSATVPIAGDPSGTLAVTAPGVYPLMINFNANLHLTSGELRARVGEVHLLLTVLSVPPAPALPGAPDASGGPSSGPSSGTTHSPTTGTTADTVAEPVTPVTIPYSMVWTIVDRPHLGVGGIFLDDDLVPEISPGGRLYQLVSTMTSIPQVAGADTVAIDPELLDELDRMSRGYWVVTPPGSVQPALTPVTNGKPTTVASAASQTADAGSGSTLAPPTTASTADPGGGSEPGASTAGGPSTRVPTQPATVSASADAPPTAATEATGATATTPTTATETAGSTTTTPTPEEQPDGTVPGTGKDAAAAFLDQLRRLAASTAVLVLPYSDPDAVALVRAGMSESLTSSVFLGRAVASRVLGVTPVPGRPSTLITDLAYPVGGLADAATLSTFTSVGDTGVILATSGVTGLPGGSSVTTVAVPPGSGSGSLAALVPNSPLLADIAPFLGGGGPDDQATTINLIAGVVAGQYFGGVGTPLLVAPGRTWAPDQAGMTALGTLLAGLGSAGVLSGTDLRALAAGATGTARVHYPSSAKAKELPASLLRRVAGADADITSLRVSTTAVDGPEGGDPDDVLVPLQEALTRVTSASFRSDRTPAGHIMSTVESSLRTIEAGVTVPASGGSLTLASSSAPLRLTLRNSLPYDVRVRIVIGGGQRVGLSTADPGIQEVPAGRSVPITIRAHVERSGTFSITAQLMTVDGRPWGAPVTLQVNSRAYGAVTLVLLIVAGSVLVLMVVIRLVQRMRARRAGNSDRHDGRRPGPGQTGGAGGETPLTAVDPPEDVVGAPIGGGP